MHLHSSVRVEILLVACLCFSNTFSRENVFNHQAPPEEVISTSGDNPRIRGVRDTRNKDFILGGLFPVHSEATGGQSCGEFRPQGGVDRVEAMLYAIDRINADPELLPNITLGYDIRDTCYVQQIGLDEAADIIITNSHAKLEQKQRLNITFATTRGPLIGIVGAGSSPVSIPVAGLSRLFSVPQISYSSTSAILNNRERYTFFYRTVPADNMEARAIIDLIRYFGWTYISVVFSKDSYGQSGADDIKEYARMYDICTDLSIGIEEDFSDSDYAELARQLVDSKANVVVLYGSRRNAERLLPHVEKYQAKISSQHDFTWIATSAWVQAVESSDELEQINDYIATAGLFGMIPHFRFLSDFSNYYLNLTISNNRRNPWFSDYYGFISGCTSNATCDENSSISELTRFEQEYAVPLTIDAVYTFAHALHKYLADKCNESFAWDAETQMCEGQMNQFNGTVFLEYINNTEFVSPTGNTISFDEHGNIKALYTIKNLQKTAQPSVTTYNLETIGIWDSNSTKGAALQLNSRQRQFGISPLGIVINRPSVSNCRSCRPGMYRMASESCCGECESCLGRNYSNSSMIDACMDCTELGYKWGNNPTEGSTACVDIPRVYLRFRNPWSIVMVIALIIGMVSVVAVSIVFGIFWKTPAITSSSRELMVLLLVGVFLSFAVVLIYVSPPSVPICALQRISLWLSFSLMFGSITVKITRIARIFVFHKSGFTRLRCMESYQQVIITFLIVLGQLVIVFISLLVKYPLVKRNIRLNGEHNNKLPELIVTCEPDPLVALVISVVYETGLIVISLALGALSFKYPANFNEAKSICCSTFGLLVIWIAFFPTYIATQDKQELQNAAIATAVLLNAYVVLVCLFGPRVFIVLFWKERNSKWFSRRRTEGEVQPTLDTTSSDFNSMYKVCKDEETRDNNSTESEENGDMLQEMTDKQVQQNGDHELGAGTFLNHVAVDDDNHN